MVRVGIDLVCGLISLPDWNIEVVWILYIVSDLCLGIIVQGKNRRSAIIVLACSWGVDPGDAL